MATLAIRNRKLSGGQKEDIIKCLPNSFSQCTTQPTIDAAILDGALIVQMLKPGTAQTFEDNLNYVFAPYIARQLETVQRVDVVWDVYHEDSEEVHKGEEGVWQTEKSSCIGQNSFRLEKL